MGISLLASSGGGPAPIVNINPSTEVGHDVPKPFLGFDESHGNGMVGWTFQLLEPFTVTQVGWYDEGADGLSRCFQVGLWQANPGIPPFWGWQSSSLIGDPQAGLIIPAGTNASTLIGVWRVVNLSEPLTLQPGFYELGGVDTLATADVIKYVDAGPQPNLTLTPPDSPVVIGALFYPGLRSSETNLHPTTQYYLASGLELGPMLFGAKTGLSSWGSYLSIRRISWESDSSSPGGILLTWRTGTVQEADIITGPYTAVTDAAYRYLIVPAPSRQKFYRLGP